MGFHRFIGRCRQRHFMTARGKRRPKLDIGGFNAAQGLNIQ